MGTVPIAGDSFVLVLGLWVSAGCGPSFPALHRRMETTLVSPKALAAQAAEALLHLQLPPSEEYHVGRKYLTFPTAQRQRLKTAALAWLEVLKTDIPKNLNGHLFAALQYWLQERQTAITTAISQRTALYSDALLLGILPVNLLDFVNGYQRVSSDFLWVDLVTTHQDNLTQAGSQYHSGKDSHLHELLAVIPSKIRKRFGLRKCDSAAHWAQDEAPEQVVEGWSQSLKQLCNKFDSLPVSAQCGLKELVYFYRLRLDEFCAANNNEAVLNLLRKWTPMVLLERVLITVEMAVQCTTPITDTNVTLERQSSDAMNPSYFHPLSLPPASPNWTWPEGATVRLDNGTIAKVAAECVNVESPPPPFDEEEQGLGSAPNHVHPQDYALTHAGYPDDLQGPHGQLSSHPQQYAQDQQFQPQQPQQQYHPPPPPPQYHPQQPLFQGQQGQYDHHQQPPAPSQERQHRRRQRHSRGPYELGSEPRIGYRVAWRYGLDRSAWTERAQRRWS
ncbi:hypothetical protein RHOSPDRAFT_27249 [Rhodotorula sp. JG-1b]|nr:hypothetical protein RHOSPDRAFT_27249 [Rhodotorula sp. JG-1b]